MCVCVRVIIPPARQCWRACASKRTFSSEFLMEFSEIEDLKFFCWCLAAGMSLLLHAVIDHCTNATSRPSVHYVVPRALCNQMCLRTVHFAFFHSQASVSVCASRRSPISQPSTSQLCLPLHVMEKSFSRHFHAVCRSPTASGRNAWKCNSLCFNSRSITLSPRSVSGIRKLMTDWVVDEKQSYLILPHLLQLFSLSGCENYSCSHLESRQFHAKSIAD